MRAFAKLNLQYDPVSRPNVLINTVFGSPADVRFDFGYNPASQIASETRDNDAYAFTGITAANKAYAVNGLNQYTAVASTPQCKPVSGNYGDSALRSNYGDSAPPRTFHRS
jgi:hypothetical protein